VTGHRATVRISTGHLVVASVLLGVSLVAAMGWIAFRVWDTATSLQRAAEAGKTAASALAAGDLDGDRAVLVELSSAGAAAGSAAQDPTWAVAAAMPVLGDDIAAVGVLARAVDTLARTLAIPAAAMFTDSTDATGTAELARWAPTLDSAVAGLADVRTELAGVDTTGLVGPIANAVDELTGILDQAAPAIETARAGAAVAGVLNGGETSVLVLMQNSAELRTGGGITGSFALLRIADGEVSLEAQADSSTFPALLEPIVPVTAAQDALYGDVVGRFVQNASMPTDFAETAQLASAWWQSAGHAAPDLVVSVDVPAIGALLNVVGAVRLPDGSELTDANIVQRVLVDPYLSLDSDQQTQLMQSAVAATVDGIAGAQIDPLRWLSALATPISEGRLSVWSADADVETLLQQSALGGPAARVAAAGDDAFGVFFNDGTGGKMDVYLHVDMVVTSAACRPDGLADVVVQLTMSSSAPADAEFALPGDVTGRGLFGTGVGDIGTSVSVSAPPGSYFGGVTKDGARALSVDVDDAGRPTSLVRVNLSPAEVNVVEFHFTMGTPGQVTPTIVHTPLLNAAAVTVAEGGCG